MSILCRSGSYNQRRLKRIELSTEWREKYVKKFMRRMEEIVEEVSDRPLRENEVEEIKLTK